jgi:hypothetical protein
MLVGLVGAVAALTVIGLAILWPRGNDQPARQSLPPTLPARIEAARETSCRTPTPQRCRVIVVRVGRDQSRLDLGPTTSAPIVSAGDAIRVTAVPQVAGVTQPRDAPR